MCLTFALHFLSTSWHGVERWRLFEFGKCIFFYLFFVVLGSAEQNLVTDDVTEGVPGGSAPSGISAEPGNGSIKRIPSTAGTLATPQSAPSAATVGEKRPGEDAVGGGSGGVGPDGEEQGLKRRRVLSVHFEDTDMQEAAAAEGAPAPPNSHPQEQHEQVNGGS